MAHVHLFSLTIWLLCWFINNLTSALFYPDFLMEEDLSSVIDHIPAHLFLMAFISLLLPSHCLQISSECNAIQKERCEKSARAVLQTFFETQCLYGIEGIKWVAQGGNGGQSLAVIHCFWQWLSAQSAQGYNTCCPSWNGEQEGRGEGGCWDLGLLQAICLRGRLWAMHTNTRKMKLASLSFS